MNLPEYRRELRRAHEDYAEQVALASKNYVDKLIELDGTLRDRISQADVAFHEDPDEAKAMEPVSREEAARMRRERG